MKKIKKSHIEGDPTSFEDLPDDIVYQIISKLSDLKTLCICELVCKYFYRTVLQVEAISFTSVTHPHVHPPNIELNNSISYTLLTSFQYAMLSLKKFTRVKSLCIELSSSFDNPLLFKWKIKFGNQLDSLLFLSPSAIYHNQILYDKENSDEDMGMKRNIMLLCLMDAMISHRMLLCCIEKIPTLENISITDSGQRRMISYSGEKINEIRNCLTPPYETIEQTLLNCKNVYHEPVEYYVPLLKLPISVYVMKGVTLMLSERHDLPDHVNLLKANILDDDFEDKDDAAYNEAMNVILKNVSMEMTMPHVL